MLPTQGGPHIIVNHFSFFNFAGAYKDIIIVIMSEQLRSRHQHIPSSMEMLYYTVARFATQVQRESKAQEN
jgi:hypothetical protein